MPYDVLPVSGPESKCRSKLFGEAASSTSMAPEYWPPIAVVVKRLLLMVIAAPPLGIFCPSISSVSIFHVPCKDFRSDFAIAGDSQYSKHMKTTRRLRCPYKSHE